MLSYRACCIALLLGACAAAVVSMPRLAKYSSSSVSGGGVAGRSGAFGDYQATGKRFDVMVLDFFRMEDGMIAEQWPAIDNLGLQQQIGMI